MLAGSLLTGFEGELAKTAHPHKAARDEKITSAFIGISTEFILQIVSIRSATFIRDDLRIFAVLLVVDRLQGF